jgi:hypothetical protein
MVVSVVEMVGEGFCVADINNWIVDVGIDP